MKVLLLMLNREHIAPAVLRACSTCVNADVRALAAVLLYCIVNSAADCLS
jgi:hypothetical protein